MFKGHLFWWIFLIFIIVIPVQSFAQQIENVSSEVSGSVINIYYDLTGIANDQPVIIRVFLSIDDGKTYGDPLKSVNGDVGIVLGAGQKKHIIWDVFQEVDELVSESVKFKVKADLLQADQERRIIDPEFFVNISANLGSKVEMKSYGFDMKVIMNLKQVGLGIKGGYYKTYGENPEIADFGYYVGFSGGAVIEYDFIRDPRYSVYPFFCIGQIKVQHKSESITSDYVGYSIFYSPGLGLDIRIAKFLYLGTELEYYMAPVVTIRDQGSNTDAESKVLDGFCIGIKLKIALNPGK